MGGMGRYDGWPLDASTAISTMVERIVLDFDPERIILFGSYAKGTAGKWSDIDLLVVMEEAPDLRETTVAIRRKLSDMPIAKDIIVTTPERFEERSRMVGTIHREVKRSGRTIYERQG